MRAPSSLEVLAERQDVAAVAHRDRKADRRFAVDAEERLRGIGISAVNLRDIVEAKHPVPDREIDVADVLFGFETAQTPGVKGSRHPSG